MKNTYLSFAACGLFVIGCSHSITNPTSDRGSEPNAQLPEDSIEESKPAERRAVQTHKNRPHNVQIELHAPSVEFALESVVPGPQPNFAEAASELAGSLPVGPSRPSLPPAADLRAEQEATQSALKVVAALPAPPPETSSGKERGELTP